MKLKNKIWLAAVLASAFCLLPSARAVEGALTLSASGTTSAAVNFPGGTHPLKITQYDVTSDAAAGTLKFHSGTAGFTVLKAAASNTRGCLTGKSTLASNDVVLLQNAAETVVLCQVSTNIVTTNKLVMLQNPLGTNLAVGDTVKTRLTSAFRLIAPAAANSLAYLVDNVTGLSQDDRLVLDRGAGLPLLSDTVDTAVTNTARKFITLKTPVVQPVTIGDVVYEVVLAGPLLCSLATNATATEIQMTNTGTLADGDKVLILCASGDRAIKTITTVTTDSKLLLSATTGIPVALYDKIYPLNATAYTAILPASPGDNSMVLSAATTLVSGDTIAVASAGNQPWISALSAAAATTNIYTLTMATGFGVAALPNAAIYKTTNTYTTILTASAADSSIVLDTATNLSAATPVIVLPASGGVFANTLGASGTDYAVSSLGFTNTLGLALASGDSVWLMGTTNSTVVGAATLRQSGAALQSFDQGRPVRAVITGTSACSINSITGDYGH